MNNYISERGQALILAAAVLDRPNADPDDDMAVLARQLMRAQEEIDDLRKDVAKLLTVALQLRGEVRQELKQLKAKNDV